MFGKIMTWLDLYGHGIGVTYRGDTFFKTKLGGFFSLVTYVLVIINTLNLIQAYAKKSDQVENYQATKQRTSSVEPFNVQSEYFIPAMWTIGYFPPSIGSWKAYLVENSIANILTDPIALNIVPCDETVKSLANLSYPEEKDNEFLQLI